MAREIALTRGKVAIVDDEDFDRLARHRWTAQPSGSAPDCWYAFRTEGRTTVYMHREVLDAPCGMLVDHRDGDGLNCQRGNLRLANSSQNLVNRHYSSRSGFRGVHAVRKRFKALISYQGERFHLGQFKDPADAARAYDAKARELHGEFAVLNFPSEAA